MNGFGLEFFIECPTSELAQRGDEVVQSWQFQLLYTVSQLAAGARSLAYCPEEYAGLTMCKVSEDPAFWPVSCCE